jgi:hypothetical protein
MRNPQPLSKIWNCDQQQFMIKKKAENFSEKDLTSTAQISNPSFRGSAVTSSPTRAEASVLPFRTVKSWRGRISVFCSSAIHSTLVCERPGPCNRGAIFIGDDLAQ